MLWYGGVYVSSARSFVSVFPTLYPCSLECVAFSFLGPQSPSLMDHPLLTLFFQLLLFHLILVFPTMV